MKGVLCGLLCASSLFFLNSVVVNFDRPPVKAGVVSNSDVVEIYRNTYGLNPYTGLPVGNPFNNFLLSDGVFDEYG